MRSASGASGGRTAWSTNAGCGASGPERRAVIDTDILIDYLAGVEAARDEIARHIGGLLITRNTKDFPPDDPGVRVPYTITGGDFS